MSLARKARRRARRLEVAEERRSREEARSQRRERAAARLAVEFRPRGWTEAVRLDFSRCPEIPFDPDADGVEDLQARVLRVGALCLSDPDPLPA